MKTRHTYVLFFLVFYTSFAAIAQNLKYRITHIGTENGLSQGSVYAMHSDAKGFMWFGTQDGLNRWNGQSMKVFRPSKNKKGHIGGIEIKKIYSDKNETLWIGTETCLNKYDYSSETFHKIFFRDKKSRVLKSEVFPLKLAGDSLLVWVGGVGLVSYDVLKNTQRIILSFDGLKTNYFSNINSTQIDKNDNIWIHNNAFLLQYNLKTKKLKYFFSNQPDNIAGKPIEIIKVLSVNNKIWLASIDKLILLNPVSGEIKEWAFFTKNKEIGLIYDIDVDSKGQVWLATEKNGILIFNLTDESFNQISRTNNFSTHTISVNEVSQIYIDNNDIIWANVDPYGIDKIQILPENFGYFKLNQFHDFSADMINSSIRCIMGDSIKNELWLGTQQTGLWRLDANTFKIKQGFYRGELPSNTIRFLFNDLEQKLWVGTTEGLAILNGAKFEKVINKVSKQQALGNFIRVISELNNKIYVGTEDGVFEVDKKTKSFSSKVILLGKRISMIRFLSENKMLVGVYNEGLQVLTSNDGFKTFKSKLVFPNAIPISSQKQGDLLWIGTSRGLVKLNIIDFSYTWIDNEDGLPNNFIYALELDNEHNVWMSTNKGIVKYEPKSGNVFPFNLNDGLQGLEFNGYSSWRDQSGRLFFGGINGLNYFVPNQIYTLANSVSNTIGSNDLTFRPKVQYAFEEKLKDEYKKPEKQNEKFNAKFRSFNGNVPNFGYGDNAIWVKIPLRNLSNGKWYLEIENPRIKDLDLWLYERNQLVWHKKSGDGLPLSISEIRNANPVFKLDLIENQDYDLYMRASTSRDLKVPISLWEESVLIKHLSDRKLIWGIYFGFVILISLFNIFLWTTIKDIMYLFYSLYILFFGLFQTTVYGFGYEYFWSNNAFNERAFLVFLFVSNIFLLFFTDRFLDFTNAWKKAWKRIKLGLLIWCTFFVLVSLFYMHFVLNFVAIFSGFLFTLCFVFILFAYLKNRSQLFLIYLISISFLTLSTFIVSIQNTGFIGSNHQEYIIMIGSMLEIVFFSLALGYKFRVNYLEKERQQKLRNEISSNLHDDLAASLSSLTMYSELSKRKNTKEDLIERFDVVALRAREILSKVREAVYDINPKNDEDNAWFERIVAFGREIFEIKNIDFRAEVSDDFNANKIPPQFRRDIFLIFKEAMNNAAKYSEANTVVLFAHKKDGKLILSLKDDGIGFMTTPEEDGNGIRNMKDRAAKIQADFILETEKGTEITLKW